MADKAIRIVFAGGGTGGHLYPAIAIANRIEQMLEGKEKVEILFVGTRRGIEYRMKDTLGYPLRTVNIRGLARSLTLKNLLVPFIAVGALIKSSSILSSFRPDVAVGTGGYVCWPVLRMAAMKNITMVLQEQNSFPGLTIRKLAGRAKRIYLGFADAKNHLRTDATVLVTGNPVRREIASGVRAKAVKEFGLNPKKKTILVLGGSQGARAINNAVLKSLETKELDEKYQLLWQTGKRDYTEVDARANRKVSVTLFPFAQDMPSVYAAADLVVARSGALTLAEVAACGLPAILVPFPHAAGDHQKKNARSFLKGGAAVMIEEKDLSEVDLLQRAVTLMESDDYGRMRKKAKDLAKAGKPAVDVIAEDIINLIGEQRKVGS